MAVLRSSLESGPRTSSSLRSPARWRFAPPPNALSQGRTRRRCRGAAALPQRAHEIGRAIAGRRSPPRRVRRWRGGAASVRRLARVEDSASAASGPPCGSASSRRSISPVIGACSSSSEVRVMRIRDRLLVLIDAPPPHRRLADPLLAADDCRPPTRPGPHRRAKHVEPTVASNESISDRRALVGGHQRHRTAGVVQLRRGFTQRPASSVRERTPSLRYTLVKRASTVATLTKRAAAISALRSPATTRSRPPAHRR